MKFYVFIPLHVVVCLNQLKTMPQGPFFLAWYPRLSECKHVLAFGWPREPGYLFSWAIAVEGLLNLGLCSTSTAFKQGPIMRYLLWTAFKIIAAR